MEIKKINPFYWLNRGKRKLMSKYMKMIYDNGRGKTYCYYDEKSQKVIDPIYPRQEFELEDEFWYIFPNHMMAAIKRPFKIIWKIVWG